MTTQRLLIICAVLLTAQTAWSAEKMGIAVYPGASPDAEATNIIKQLSGDGACYKVNAPVAKVVEFYKKLKGLQPMTPPPGEESPATVFNKGDSVQVRVQPLPANPREVHICIVKAD